MLERAKEPWECKPLSPSLPTYQRLLLLLQRQSEGFFCFKCDFNIGKDADFVGHGHFLCKEVFIFSFFPELPLVGQLLFCLHPALEQALGLSPLQWFMLALTPVWVLSKARTALQLWSGTITLFFPAKDLAGHVATFLTLKRSKMQSVVNGIMWQPFCYGCFGPPCSRVVCYRTAQGALLFVDEELWEGGRGGNTTETILFPPKASWGNTPFFAQS